MKSEVHGAGDSANVVPAFLSKLWTLVEDESTNELICWDVTGKSFHVFDQGRFAKEMLPLYFKHNNIASFIRQLNMYGFRKVMNVENGGLKVERDDLEFAHTYFVQGHPYLLENIKRKVSNVKGDEVRLRHDSYNQVLSDVHNLRGKQDTMNTKLDTLKRENEALWREVANLRQKHMKQQQIVNKLIQFIVTLVGSNKRGIPTGMKRHYPLMINDASQLNPPRKKAKREPSDELKQGVQIHDVTDLMQGPDAAVPDLEEPVVGIVSELSPQAETTASPTALADHTGDVLFQASQGSLEPLALLTEGGPASLEDISTLIEPVAANNILNVTDTSLPPLFPETQLAGTTASTATTSGMATAPSTSNAVALNPKKSVTGDMSDHVDKMQADLDTLKDLLATSTYNLDNSTIFSLFNPEGPIPASPENLFSEFGDVPLLGFEQPGTSLGNELISYQPTDTGDLGQLFDLPDMTPSSDPLDLGSGDLTTPVVSPSATEQISTEDVD